jgi:thiol-disulfide isomerase/thioredoxin
MTRIGRCILPATAAVAALGAGAAMTAGLGIIDEHPYVKEQRRPEQVQIGAMAADFTVVTADGRTLRLADFRGKPLIVDFWATWCHPCIDLMPDMKKVHEHLAGREVAFIAICVGDTREAFDKWVADNGRKYGLTFAYDTLSEDFSKGLAAAYRINAIPTTFMIDAEGRIVDALGYPVFRKALNEGLAKIGLPPFEQ